MLTLQPNHQVMFHLSQLSNCVSVTSTQVVNGLKTLTTKKLQRPLDSDSITCNESLEETVKNVASEMIVYLPKVNKRSCQSNKKMRGKTGIETEEFRRAIQMLSPLKPLKLERTYQAPWEVSFVSTNSFEENKKLGFSRILSANAPSVVVSRNLQPKLLQINNHTQQVRGFKTERIVQREKERDGSVLNQIANIFRSKPAVKPPALNSENLKFADAKTVDAVVSALGRVYGDGYTAAQNTEKLKKFRWFVYGLLLAGFLGGNIFLLPMLDNPFNGSLKQVTPEEIDVTFADVRGSEQVKKELLTVVSFLKNPKKYAALGARLPKGVLLVGEPGVGKTLLARAVAGEARVPFFYASGSEFDEVLVGEGARRIRNLFRAAKANAPCVIFLDEIDSLGAKRSKSSVHPYANQSINQLLSEMDGFQANEGVVVLAATNRESDLDRALVRPGRFDMSIQVPQPLMGDRRDILQYYLQKIACRNIDIETLVKLTGGWNGADIENLVNWAAIKAASENAEYVHMHHLLDSFDRIVLGIPWQSGVNSDSSLRKTAYHEAGHALVSFFTPGSRPLHKVTIEPRGSSLGHTSSLIEDEESNTRSRIIAEIDMSFGGQVAEELIYGKDETSTGCASDLAHASTLAHQMVKRFGMGDLNRALDRKERLGADTANAVDNAINAILNESKERAKKVLLAHAAELHKLVEALVEYKTLNGEEIQRLFSNCEDANIPKDQ